MTNKSGKAVALSLAQKPKWQYLNKKDSLAN